MAMNCVIVDDDSLSVRLLEGLIAQTESLVHTRSFSSAVEAVNFLRENAVDILFLDVEMPGMTGLELLGALETKPAVILVSSKAEYAVDGFQFDVEDFLLKPLTYARFLKAVKKVEDKFNQDQAVQFKGDYVFVKSDTALVKVDIRQLMWVEALADLFDQLFRWRVGQLRFCANKRNSNGKQGGTYRDSLMNRLNLI